MGGGGVREGENIDCFIVHHVTMTHDLTNIKYDMINNLLQFSNNLDKITDQAVKNFKNGHNNQTTMSKIQTIHNFFRFFILPGMIIVMNKIRIVFLKIF